MLLLLPSFRPAFADAWPPSRPASAAAWPPSWLASAAAWPPSWLASAAAWPLADRQNEYFQHSPHRLKPACGCPILKNARCFGATHLPCGGGAWTFPCGALSWPLPGNWEGRGVERDVSQTSNQPHPHRLKPACWGSLLKNARCFGATHSPCGGDAWTFPCGALSWPLPGN